jgi:NAD(P)-dependent dehydrogenase (short-subunit alcohol dehydrogenase family)
MGRLDSKVAVVTGGAQGIGRAIAEGLVQEGGRVAIADVVAEKAVAAARELNEAHARPAAVAVSVDVSDRASVERMIDETVRSFGQLDILVNNAAMWKSLERRPFWEVPPEEWDRVFAVNTRGPFLCTAAVTPLMRRQRHGKIIFIGSATIWTGQSRLAPYVCSKAALIGLVRCVARELGPDNICVNMIHPGITDTGGVSREYLEERSKLRAIPRVQVPRDLVGAAVFLSSDESDFITGQQLHVDGGMVFG